MIGSATASVKRFVATFFVARLESVLLTTVFDALVLYRNRDVPVPCSVLGLWELHGSSFCTSESQASVVRRTGAVGTWCRIATGTPTICSARLNRAHLPFITTRTSTTGFWPTHDALFAAVVVIHVFLHGVTRQPRCPQEVLVPAQDRDVGNQVSQTRRRFGICCGVKRSSEKSRNTYKKDVQANQASVPGLHQQCKTLVWKLGRLRPIPASSEDKDHSVQAHWNVLSPGTRSAPAENGTAH